MTQSPFLIGVAIVCLCWVAVVLWRRLRVQQQRHRELDRLLKATAQRRAELAEKAEKAASTGTTAPPGATATRRIRLGEMPAPRHNGTRYKTED